MHAWKLKVAFFYAVVQRHLEEVILAFAHVVREGYGLVQVICRSPTLLIV